MKIAHCEHAGLRRLGIVSESNVIFPDLERGLAEPANGILSLIEAGEDTWAKLPHYASSEAAERVELSKVKLLAPIPVPNKNVICLGWNYAEHAQETARARGRQTDLPEHPIVFTKAVTSVTGPFDDIPYDEDISAEMDWEVELGVIIGRGGRHIKETHALEHVFGYTVINDISARDLQFRHKQYFLGKSLEGACPMGPWVVTRDEIGDPQRLDLQCGVNGIAKQHSNTRFQIFPVAQTIAILSKIIPLQAGDIIATGTPSGVGFARKPPEFLRPNDIVECYIENIGAIRNKITEESVD